MRFPLLPQLPSARVAETRKFRFCAEAFDGRNDLPACNPDVPRNLFRADVEDTQFGGKLEQTG
jgi:hypothetical protein